MDKVVYIKDYLRNKDYKNGVTISEFFEVLEINGDEKSIMDMEIKMILSEENEIEILDEPLLKELNKRFKDDKLEEVFLKLKSESVNLEHIEKIKERLHNELNLKVVNYKKISDYIIIDCVYDVVEVDFNFDDVGVTLEELKKMIEDDE